MFLYGRAVLGTPPPKIFVVDREPSSFISWTGERLDMPGHGLLSRVGITSRSRTALPPAEASLDVRLLCP